MIEEPTGPPPGEFREEFDEALEQALEGEPRAEELRSMQKLLSQRRQGIQEDLKVATDPKEQTRLQRALEEVEEQIGVLGEEADITRFVEEAVRVGLEIRRRQM